MARTVWNNPAPAVQALMLQVADEIGRALVERARELVPVDTGATRDSIAYRVEQAGGQVHIILGAYTEYAIFIELGTVHWSGQPFLRPAIDSIGQDIAARFAAAFQAASAPSYAGAA
jgi:HK97 gp10 family phage protein